MTTRIQKRRAYVTIDVFIFVLNFLLQLERSHIPYTEKILNGGEKNFLKSWFYFLFVNKLMLLPCLTLTLGYYNYASDLVVV
jgi:hypothetical protein